MTKIIIPEVLSKYTFGNRILTIDCKDAQDLKSLFKKKFAQLYSILFSEDDELYGYIAIYKNHHLSNIFQNNDLLSSDDTVEIIIPVSGG